MKKLPYNKIIITNPVLHGTKTNLAKSQIYKKIPSIAGYRIYIYIRSSVMGPNIAIPTVALGRPWRDVAIENQIKVLIGKPV